MEVQSEPPRVDDSLVTEELCAPSPLPVPGHQVFFLLHLLPTLPFITVYPFIPSEAVLAVIDVPGQI